MSLTTGFAFLTPHSPMTPCGAARFARPSKLIFNVFAIDGSAYVEVGGWALSEQWRGTRAALEILVGSYALAQLWGGCVGSCTATVRHSSSSMLRRLGGQSFEIAGQSLPSYNDPEYECVMELLRFDYRSPAARFLPLINQLRATLSRAPVVTDAEPEPFGVRLREFIPEHASRLRLTPVFIS